METLRFTRRTFVASVGGAGAGFYLFGRPPGMRYRTRSPRSRAARWIRTM